MESSWEQSSQAKSRGEVEGQHQTGMRPGQGTRGRWLAGGWQGQGVLSEAVRGATWGQGSLDAGDAHTRYWIQGRHCHGAGSNRIRKTVG